jgi:hypothetical protein
MDFLALHNSPECVAARTAAIHETVLRESHNLKQANFTSVGTDDLARLFELYDRAFFGGELARAVEAATGRPLGLRLSTTMTRAGGKTIFVRQMMPDGRVQSRYEIAVACRMLFMTFGRVERPVFVVGMRCADRLEALQRILEHEIIHLVESLAWGKTSCRGQRFKDLAASIFGHTGAFHTLVTPVEHAAARHGVRPGGVVEFDFDGRRLAGRISRIHRRATVLVEDADGELYTDGKKYHKYYVPLDVLRPVSAAGSDSPPPDAGPAAALP